MNFLVLFLDLIIAIEIIYNFKFFYKLNLINKLLNRAIRIISNKKISDHWKEKIIPKYSLKIFINSFLMLLLLSLILFVFYITSLIFEDFYIMLFSFKGIFLSILFSVFYNLLKNNLIK